MRLKTALAAAMLLVPALPCAAADLSGTWVVNAQFKPDFKYTLICLLKADSGRLSGPCTAIVGRVLKASGRATGDSMAFGYLTEFNGNGLHLDYSGHRQADGVVKGPVKTGISEGRFEASPLPDFSVGDATAWKIDVGFPPAMKYVVLCSLKSDQSKLHGPCGVATGPTLRASGEATRDLVTFAYDTEFQGQPTHVTYQGALQADGSLKGAVTSNGATGTFTATRP